MHKTKQAIERVGAFLDSRAVSKNLDPELIHAHNDNELLASDLRHLLAALSAEGELNLYGQWLDSQGIINGEVELTDDSGNETGEFDTRSHPELVADYIKETWS